MIIFRIGITIDVHAVIRENRDFQLIAHDSGAGSLLCIAPGVLYKNIYRSRFLVFFLFALFYFFGIRDYLVSQEFVLTGFIACLVVIIFISCIPMKSDFGVKVTPGSLSRSISRQRAGMGQWIEEAGS